MLGADAVTPGAVQTPSAGATTEQFDLYGFNYYTFNGKQFPIMSVPASGSINGLFTVERDGSWGNRNRFRYDNNSVSAKWYAIIAPTDVAFDGYRTGTWYFHANIRCGGYGPTANDYATLGYLDKDGTQRQLSASASFVTTPEVYVEIIVDWEAKVVGIYKGGALVASAEFTALTGEMRIGFNTRVATAKGGWSTMGDVYFVIDAIDDPNPTGRLGPCMVKAAKITDLVTDGEFKSKTSATPTTVLGMMSAGVYNAQGVVSDSRGKEAYLTYDSGTDIVEAASLRVMGYVDTDTIALNGFGVKVNGVETTVTDIGYDRITPGYTHIFSQDAYDVPLNQSSLSNLPSIGIYTKR